MLDEWTSIETLPLLEARELQLWRIDLDQAAERAEMYLRHLSANELERTVRLRAGRVRMQFVVARACLRMLLGLNLGVKPIDAGISYNAYGKPEVRAFDRGVLFFNVAHSRSTALIALCRDGRVGIDIEYLDPRTDVLQIARGSFTPMEYQSLAQVEDARERQRAFFHCWTRKEAVVKADGRGLSLPLTSFEVSVTELAVASPIRFGDGLREPETTYFVTDLGFGDDAVGAVALEMTQANARLFDFPITIA